MLLRFALCIGMTAAALAWGAPQQAWAQKPADSPTAPAKPETSPAPTTAPAPFAEEVTLVAKPIVSLKGTGTWDKVYETITNSIKTLRAYMAKEGLKADGAAMTIFTATDDTGFQYQAAVPVAEPPKTAPSGEVAAGSSPQGRALKFVHRGSYDGLDNTYEAITNYLDEKRLEAGDMFIEQYVTDPLPSNEDNLVINIFVMIK
jgi:effector-binding domain-containing protein